MRLEIGTIGDRTELISVIVPIYNKADYLEASLSSLFAQSIPAEFILVNDNSTDIGPEVIKELASKDSRAKIFNLTKHMGMAICRDFGIKHSSGDRLILHDADEIIPSDYLARMSEGLDRFRMVHPSIVYQYGLDHKIRRYYRNINYPSIPARGFHKSDYERVKGFDLSLGSFELASFRFRMKAIDQHIELIDTYVIDLGVLGLRQLYERSYNLYRYKLKLATFLGESWMLYHIRSLMLPFGLITIKPTNFVKTLGAIKGYIRRA